MKLSLSLRTQQFIFGSALVAILLAVFSVFFSINQGGLIFFALLGLATVLVLFVFWPTETYLFLLGITPWIFRWNNYKFDLGFLLKFINAGNFLLTVNLSALVYLLLIFLSLLVVDFKRLKGAGFFYWLLAFLIYSSFSIFWAASPNLGIAKIFQLLVLPAVFLLSFHFTQEFSDLKKLIYLWVLSAIPPIVESIYQLVSHQLFYEPDSSLGRIFGGLNHPNTLGLFLAVVLSLILIAFEAFSIKEKSSLKIIFLGLLLFLVLTFSRTAWGVLLFFSIFFFLKNKKYYLYFCLIGLMVFAILWSFELSRNRIKETFENSMFNSMYARKMIWQMASEKIQEKPYFGYGLGNFEEVILDAKETAEGTALAHNDLVLCALESGYLGLILFIFYQLALIRFLFQKTRTLIDRRLKRIMEGFLALALALMIASQLETISQKIIIQLVFWSTLGAIFSLIKNQQQKNLSQIQ